MVSLDKPERNREFADSLGARHVLLSDPTGEVARAYGVRGFGGLFARRWTFYIDREGVIRHIAKHVNVERKREAKRDKQIKNIDDAEQYALIAKVPGYYECLHCPSKRIFLHTNEIWKYGVTNQGKKQRYSSQFLKQKRLDYLVDFIGTYSQCLAEEKRKLFDYPLFPENIARPDSLKLVLPPGNLQLR